MVKTTRPPGNGFVAVARKIYNPLGFSKGYNFVLWFIACGYIFGFTLARLEYLSFYGIFCNPNVHGASGAAPGECYYYLQNPFKVGMMMHLYTILPAAFLVVFQFTPAIRHKVILFHRINGYLIITLSLISSGGALIIAPHAFGGDFSTRTFVGTLVIATTVAYIFAWINIKRLQIDQHRAWMMRTWAYFSCIITIRIIFLSASAIITHHAGWWTTKPCAQINFALGKQGTLSFFSSCAPFFAGNDPNLVVPVKAGFPSANPLKISAALSMTFGGAGWLALTLHAVMVEVYLRLTPAESDRLRQVSYERQRERGMRHPGSAGLVAQRLGDANPYVPMSILREMNTSEAMGMLGDDAVYRKVGDGGQEE